MVTRKLLRGPVSERLWWSVSVDAKCVLISVQKRSSLISGVRTQVLNGSFKYVHLLDQFRNSVGRRRCIVKEIF